MCNFSSTQAQEQRPEEPANTNETVQTLSLGVAVVTIQDQAMSSTSSTSSSNCTSHDRQDLSNASFIEPKVGMRLMVKRQLVPTDSRDTWGLNALMLGQWAPDPNQGEQGPWLPKARGQDGERGGGGGLLGNKQCPGRGASDPQHTI